MNKRGICIPCIIIGVLILSLAGTAVYKSNKNAETPDDSLDGDDIDSTIPDNFDNTDNSDLTGTINQDNPAEDTNSTDDPVNNTLPYPGPPANVGSELGFIKDEELKNNENCSTGFEMKGEFIDSTGNTIKNCLLRIDSFAQGAEFVTNVYLENFNGAESCPRGGDGTGWFIDETGNQVYLCVEKSVPETAEEVVNDAMVSEDCTNGYVQHSEPIELPDKMVLLCVI